MKLIKGFAFHVHHSILAEWCYDFNRRVEAIKQDKPKEEQELRLRLFKLIPKDRLPKDLIKAMKDYNKVWDAYDKAAKDYDKAEETYNTGLSCLKAAKTLESAGKALEKVGQAYVKVLNNNKDFLEILHSELCPNCPWDGESIFRRGERRCDGS